MSSGRTLGSLLLAVLVGCGPSVAPVTDASVSLDASPDAARSGTLGLAIEGPDFAFAGESACFRAVHDGGPDARVSVVWADGQRDELAIGVDEACHTYAYPGPLVMGMTVEARGMRADQTRLVHVVIAPAAVRPTASTSIAFDAARSRVWAVEPDADQVTAIDAPGRTLLGRATVGDRPRTVAILGDLAFVACQGDGTVHVLDSKTLSPRSVIAFGAGTAPFGVLADPRGGRVWVTLSGSGELASIEEGAIGARLAVGPDVRALAMTADGTIALPRWRSSQEAAAVVLVDATLPSSPRLASTALLPRDVGRDSDTDSDGVLSFVSAIAASPDGGRVVVGGLKANTVAGTFRSDHPLTSQTTARGTVAELTLGAPDEPATDSFRHAFDDLDSVSAAVFSPMGDRMFVAIAGAEVVIAVDGYSFDSLGSLDDTGHAVDGLALDPEGRFLFVHASLSRSVRVYDVTDLSRDPELAAEISTLDVEPFAPEVLQGARIFHSSRDPRMSRTRYLSCASCHADGEGDNLVWDFTQRGEGLRNTIPLVGRAGVAHGPIHWSANFDEVQDFEHDIRGGQGGTGFLPDDVFHVGTRDMPLGDAKAGLSPELDALAAYLGSLDSFGVSPTRREDDAAWVAARARGEALFRDASVGCASCHAGERYTDSAFDAAHAPLLHDVGTLASSSGSRLSAPLVGLDTPTLRGLWSTAPYLHDGSARTLREVLRDRNPADRHGRTSGLLDPELADLEIFLLSLDDEAP